jgi:hypothetical protein
MGALSSALNKAGICQEIDFKCSDYLVFNDAHESQLNIWYDHHGHRTELVFVEACCQSGLPGYEGAIAIPPD